MRVPCQHSNRSVHVKVCLDCGRWEPLSRLRGEALEDAYDDLDDSPPAACGTWFNGFECELELGHAEEMCEAFCEGLDPPYVRWKGIAR